MKTILKKMTALFATALILLTALPVSASAQSRIQIENADVFGTTQEIVIGDGLFIDHRNYWCMMHTMDSMRAVYCLEPGRSVSSGDVYETDDTYSYLDCVQNPMLNSAEIQQLLKRVFQHAYTGNLDTAESYFQYVATQLLVWEVVVGQCDMNFELADKVGKYYLQYEESIKNHAESVSFAYASEYEAEEFTVEADENNLYIFTDDNTVLSQFEVTVMGGQVIELTDSTLQIQVDTGETAWMTMTAKNDGIGFITLALESHQTLAELCADTPVYYAAVKAAPIVTTKTTTTTTTTETTSATTEITTTSSSTSQTTAATMTSTSSEVTTTTAETTLSTTSTQTTNSSLQTISATTTSTTQVTTSQTTPITTTTEQITSTTTTTSMLQTTTTSAVQTTVTSSESTSTTTNVTPESTITNTEMTTEITSATTETTENTTTTAISTVTSEGTTVTSTTTRTGKTIPSAPNVPKQDTPSTGDERTSVLPLVFAGMGIALIAGVLFLDKKVHSHEEKK